MSDGKLFKLVGVLATLLGFSGCGPVSDLSFTGELTVLQGKRLELLTSAGTLVNIETGHWNMEINIPEFEEALESDYSTLRLIHDTRVFSFKLPELPVNVANLNLFVDSSASGQPLPIRISLKDEFTNRTPIRDSESCSQDSSRKVLGVTISITRHARIEFGTAESTAESFTPVAVYEGLYSFKKYVNLSETECSN